MKLGYILSFLLIVPCFGEEVIKSEIEMQSEQLGIEISTLNSAVEKGTPGALSIYLALSLDGGGGEVFHYDNRPEVLRAQPDERLAKALAGFSEEKIQEIGKEFIYRLGPNELTALKQRFPLTFRIIAESKTNKSGPYALMDNDFVTDLTLRETAKSSDLKSLLLTLPVFEISPTERKALVDKMGVINKNKLFVQGDGAQPSLTLVKLDKPKHYELIIHALEEQTNWHYHMIRNDEVGFGYNGWSITSRKSVDQGSN